MSDLYHHPEVDSIPNCSIVFVEDSSFVWRNKWLPHDQYLPDNGRKVMLQYRLPADAKNDEDITVVTARHLDHWYQVRERACDDGTDCLTIIKLEADDDAFWCDFTLHKLS